MEATSGSYLDRMESFLSKHDNASLTDLVKEDENADNYEVKRISLVFRWKMSPCRGKQNFTASSAGPPGVDQRGRVQCCFYLRRFLA